MLVTQRLHELGQSLWLDHLDRDLLDSRRFAREVARFSVTGATTHPGMLARCIRDTLAYNASIFIASSIHKEPEDVFYAVYLEDVVRACALLAPVREQSRGQEGWVTLPVSPRLREAPRHMHAQAHQLHAEAGMPGVAIELPATSAGLAAAEEVLSEGVPVMVTHVFSPAQYRAAADAGLRALERRVASDGEPRVPCFIAVDVAAWDRALERLLPGSPRGALGLAIAQSVYRSFCEDIGELWADRLAEPGALPLRLVWAGTGVAPSASDARRVEQLAAKDTVAILSELALLTFARHGEVHLLLPRDGGNAREVLADFARMGIEVDRLASALQRESLLASREAWLEVLSAVDQRAQEVHLTHGDIRV